MNNILIRSNKVAGLMEVSAAVPNDVEYEQLTRNLNNATYKKYEDRTDLRKSPKTFIEDKSDINNKSKTFILSPGMLIDYENPQSDSTPRFDSNGPWRQGIPWE